MKETKFVDQHKDKWSRFEKAFDSDSVDPDELTDLYLDITEDLSYAQTFYNKRTVRVYLNQLSQRVYSGVHKQKSDNLKRLITVWRLSLPLEIYRSRKTLSLSLFVFLLYVVIGVITTHFQPDFPRIVLGDAYVDMTIENIKAGNPLKVYETDSQMYMFLTITTNNLKVAFLTFMAGFFFSIGTHILLFSNGVMLGSFQYFFALKGLLLTSFLGIWIHGAFEISSIVLAGGAGLIIGNGLLFPGTYSRLQSLKLAAKRGLKIMLSLVPFIIAAGFLESYVTHNYQDLHTITKWLIILFSFALILFVYVYYPIRVARKHPELLVEDIYEVVIPNRPVKIVQIRKISEIVSDTFQLFRSFSGNLFKQLLRIVIPVVLVIIIFQDSFRFDDLGFSYWFDWMGFLELSIGFGFKHASDWLAVICWSFLIAYMFNFCSYTLNKNAFSDSESNYLKFFRSTFWKTCIGVIPILSFVFFLPWYVQAWFSVFVPFFWMFPAVFTLENGSFGEKFKKSFSYSASNYFSSLMIIILLFILIFLLGQPFAFCFSIHEGAEPMVSDLLDLSAGFIDRILSEYTSSSFEISNLFRQIVYLVALIGTIPVISFFILIGYFSIAEERSALSLEKDLQNFGKRHRLKEREVDFE